MSWRYIATRLHGDGTESIIDNELPLSDVTLTTALSGADGLDAKVTPEYLRLKDERGQLILLAWSTAIYAETEGRIRHGAILTDTPAQNDELGIEAVGFTGYLKDIPYTATRSRVKTDPLVEARHIWAHVQGHKRGNLGVKLDSTTSPVRIGTKSEDVEFQTGTGENVSFEAGPYKLNWWTTHDLGSEFDKLAENTPFDYRMEHAWDGEQISHRLRLGYPTLGRRRHDLRFVIGENVTQIPDVDFSGDDFANEALVLGSGEGRKMVRGTATRPSDRLRRVIVYADKSLSSKKRATATAEREVKSRLGEADVTELMVANHPHARIGSYVVGDEIRLQGDTGWGGDLDLWVRVVEITISPDESDDSRVSVIRADKVEG